MCSAYIDKLLCQSLHRNNFLKIVQTLYIKDIPKILSIFHCLQKKNYNLVGLTYCRHYRFLVFFFYLEMETTSPPYRSKDKAKRDAANVRYHFYIILQIFTTLRKHINNLLLNNIRSTKEINIIPNKILSFTFFNYFHSISSSTSSTHCWQFHRRRFRRWYNWCGCYTTR